MAYTLHLLCSDLFIAGSSSMRLPHRFATFAMSITWYRLSQSGNNDPVLLGRVELRILPVRWTYIIILSQYQRHWYTVNMHKQLSHTLCIALNRRKNTHHVTCSPRNWPCPAKKTCTLSLHCSLRKPNNHPLTTLTGPYKDGHKTNNTLY